MISIIINGIGGQMGRTITFLALMHSEEYRIVAGVDCCDCDPIKNIPIYKSIEEVNEPADVVIDFSLPAALDSVLTYCQERGIAVVVGTTGLKENETRLLNRAAAKVPVFQSGNMSLGVNLQIELAKKAASKLGDNFDVEIVEAHHNRKLDAPSGTALMIANAISTQYTDKRRYVYGRHASDHRREHNEIGLHSIRGGTIVGEHTVQFIGQDEVIEITHKAYSKQVFGMGALRAAGYLMHKQPGLYNMQDIMTESHVLSHVYTQDHQAIITIGPMPHEANLLSHVFSLLAQNNVFIDMISQTVPGGNVFDVSFSLPKAQLASAMNALKGLRELDAQIDIHAMDNITKLTVEGPGMALRHGVAAQLFDVLNAVDVRVELVTTSETKISCCISSNDVPSAVNAITEHFCI